MKLIIDIPEDEYNVICNGTFDTDGYFRINLSNAFKNGTSLPKGHGRLIDASEIVKTYALEKKTNALCGDDAFIEAIKQAPTIIEADKAESENA